MPHHTFTSAGRLSDPDQNGNPFNQTHPKAILRIGKVGAADLGTGLDIMVVTEDGGRHVVRSLTALAELTDNTVILVQPDGAQIDLEAKGTPNLYVEYKEFRDEESQR